MLQHRTCAICGQYDTTAIEMHEHHVIPRSLGGEVTVLICNACHSLIHAQEWRWKLEVDEDGLTLYDNGEVAVHRPTPPQDFSEATFLGTLQNVTGALGKLGDYFPYLSDDGIVHAAESLGLMGTQEWHLKARLLRVATLRTPYGSKGAVMLDAARLFSIGRAQAYKYVRALQLAEQSPTLSTQLDNLPNPDAIILSAAQDDPEKAAELLVERSTAQPGYSAKAFRKDLAQDGEVNRVEYERCPTCGHWRPKEG